MPLLGGMPARSFAEKPPITCEYTAYRPETALAVILQSLGRFGLIPLPEGAGVQNLADGNRPIVKANELVAQYGLHDDVRTGGSSLIFYDLESKILLSIFETTTPCPAYDPIGKCKRIDISPEIDLMGKAPPFSVLKSPDKPTIYRRYMREINVVRWRKELGEAVAWLTNVLNSPAETFPVLVKGAKDRLFVALASDPVLLPYVSQLNLSGNANGWMVSGVVPSEAYQMRVLRAAQNVGFRNLRMNLTIDTQSRALTAAVPTGCYQ